MDLNHYKANAKPVWKQSQPTQPKGNPKANPTDVTLKQI